MLWCALVLAFGWTSASAQEFRVQSVDVGSGGAIRVRYPSDPAYYYILFRGTAVTHIVSAADMALGVPLEGQFSDDTVSLSVAFYRVLRVPTTRPLDADGDGIDDVWELRFRLPGAALNPTDANQDHTGSGTPDLVEYWNSLPLVAWFTNTESSALSYGGAVNVALRFTKPVTGVFAYEVGGNATAGKDYQPLSGIVTLNNSLTTTLRTATVRPTGEKANSYHSFII